MYPRFLLVVLIGVFSLSPCLAGEKGRQLGFEVPPGFEVTLYADDSLATDIHSMTIDAQGRVVVAGPGYIKILHDTDRDGKADKATLFADFPKSGAHGMYFDGHDLICNGDKGVRRLYDTRGVGKCDRVGPIWLPTIKDTEHAANGIVKGPDGWFYMITGNDAGISKEHITNSPSPPGGEGRVRGNLSPVKDPNAGVVIRISPDGQKREVIAHGFRNPYDLAFNHLGQLFTVDADGERVHHMPYYAPTRLFDIAQGMHHGWLLPGWVGSWSRPPWWPDNVERMLEIGRGSPTGLLVYRHRAFPEKYRNGVFHLCWTFGRLYFFPLNPSGSSYDTKMEVFMKTTGDVGFAPTDMAVGPDGDLFISIGGRGTRGSVFRVKYKGPSPPTPGDGDPLREVLAADEPLTSWSRAHWVPRAKTLGKEAFLKAVANGNLALEERIRAVEILTELFDGIPDLVAKKICLGKENPELIARVIWSVSRASLSMESRFLLTDLTGSKDLRVARAAWEALVCLPEDRTLTPDWRLGLNSPDRRIRAATIAAARGTHRASFLANYTDSPKFTSSERLAYLWVQENSKNQIQTCLEICDQEKDPVLRLEAVRLLQLALGDVIADNQTEKFFMGYIAQKPNQVDAKLRKQMALELAKSFPSGDRFLDLELARLFGMLGELGEDVPGLLEKICTKMENSLPEDDIHYLLVMTRLPGKRSKEVSQKTAQALNGIHVKLAQRGAKPTDMVPGILEAALDRLMHFDSALASALVQDPAFGMPGHALYANLLPLSEKQRAARKLLQGLAGLDPEQVRLAWTPELIRLVATLPDPEALPILRKQFADPRLADSIALFLARNPRPEDRPRLIEALGSTQAGVVGAAAQALRKLSLGKDKISPVEIGKGVQALRRLESNKADLKTRQELASLLIQWTGEKIGSQNLKSKEEIASAWVHWYTKAYPKEADSLPGLVSSDFASWKKRLDKIAWETGDQKRGELVFQKKNCFRCHGDVRRLGPDLAGIAQRFSRDDLFTAILDPSKDIAPAYQPTAIVTHSGKVYSGVVIYSSPVLYLLQTTPDTTVRIPLEELQIIQPSRISFMPNGLLDDLKDGELADLYAYLKTLTKR